MTYSSPKDDSSQMVNAVVSSFRVELQLSFHSFLQVNLACTTCRCRGIFNGGTFAYMCAMTVP